MDLVAEDIPDDDSVSRTVEFPIHFSNVRDLIWEKVFLFGDAGRISTIWRKYAADDEHVHAIGLGIVETKNERLRSSGKEPDRKYEGFVTGQVGSIRNIRTVRGHGFQVDHAPNEGRHHVHIAYLPAGDTKLKPSERAELRERIANLFGNYIGYLA
jgi:hypothetical protein